MLVNLKVFSGNVEKPDDDDNDKTDQQDRGVMSLLEEKLSKEKCEETLYGELLTAKLKKFPHHWLRAKHDISNIKFKCICIDSVPEKRKLKVLSRS